MWSHWSGHDIPSAVGHSSNAFELDSMRSASSSSDVNAPSAGITLTAAWPQKTMPPNFNFKLEEIAPLTPIQNLLFSPLQQFVQLRASRISEPANEFPLLPDQPTETMHGDQFHVHERLINVD